MDGDGGGGWQLLPTVVTTMKHHHCFQQWWCFMVIVSICVHGQLVFVAVGGCCGQLLLFAMWVVVVGHCVC